MSKPFISLCPEITRSNAFNLKDWLAHDEVIRYLSDSRDVSRSIEQVLERVQLPVLTHLFSQGGRFFMAYDERDTPVGFVRLIQSGTDCEIVLVIGNSQNWGRQMGASTLLEGMKFAFFEMRAERLIAKIHIDNQRSQKTFMRCGFQLDKASTRTQSYAIRAPQYLQGLRARTAEAPSGIHITELDQQRLRELLAYAPEPDSVELQHEVERAIVVEPGQVAEDVVTMNSRALLRLNDEKVAVDLVYPEDADEAAGKLSIYSDIGTAILGYKAGDAIHYRSPHRTCQVRIEKVLYQPEAAGDYHL